LQAVSDIRCYVAEMASKLDQYNSNNNNKARFELRTHSKSALEHTF
jgi:hypothetical protein